MVKEDNEIKQNKGWKKQVTVNKSDWGGIYGLGILGAAVYYIQHATTFWIGVLGIIKAFFWPAVLVYYVFATLKL